MQHLIATACGNIRELLDVPDNYRILLFQVQGHLELRIHTCDTLATLHLLLMF